MGRYYSVSAPRKLRTSGGGPPFSGNLVGGGGGGGGRWKGDHWGTIDPDTYAPRFNQSLLKTLSRPSNASSFPRTLDLEHAARADNVIERNADRIGWRE